MPPIFEYIANYCKVHGIKNYSVKSKVLVKKHFANPLTFAPGIAFFYRLSIDGEIENIENINNAFLTINTPTEFFNFADIADITDNVTLQHAQSDFIFVCDNMLRINLSEGNDALFSKIYNAKLFYYYVTPLPDADGNTQNINVDIIRTN